MDTKKLIQIANIVDAKGLHSLADEIDRIAQGRSSEVDREGRSLEANIAYYNNHVSDLTKVADVLDSHGLSVLANQLDRIIEIEALEQQSAIDVILTLYKKRHCIAGIKKEGGIRKDNLPEGQRCPFGLPIPQACKEVGVSINDMEPGETDKNKAAFEQYKAGKKCPYAEQVIEEKGAVNCTHGTEVEGRETTKMYRSSPIYPRLFEGFNTINLDRNYYQYLDFSYYSLYG